MTVPTLTPEAAREWQIKAGNLLWPSAGDVAIAHLMNVPHYSEMLTRVSVGMAVLSEAQRRAGIQEGLRMAALALCSYCRHIPAQRSPIKGAPRWFHGYPETGGDSCDCPASEVWRAIEERERAEGAASDGCWRYCGSPEEPR